MRCRLLQLPNEVLTDILDYIENEATLRSIASVCSRLQDIVEPRLYEHIFHRSGEQALELRRAIDGRPKRASYIQKIDSRCKWTKRHGLISLDSVIARAYNLRDLTIESPYCKNAYGHEKEIWRQTMYHLLRPIRFHDFRDSSLWCHQLTNVTLHLSGVKRFWTIDEELATLFAHPTIESLTLSCAEIHEDDLQALSKVVRTPLKQLTFIECNLTNEALSIILSRPYALSQLHLGENCHHQWINRGEFRESGQRHVNRLCSAGPEQFFQSLGQQKHSLKNLSYLVKGPSLSQIDFPERCQGLTNFTQLTEIMLDGYCPYFEKALALRRTAPPNLRSLIAKGDMFRLQCHPNLSLADDYQSHISWTIASMDLSPHLETVRLVSNRTFTNVSNNHREAVKQLGQAFIARGVSMELYRRNYHGNIPPFLYGENECTEELVYDTESGLCEELRPSGDRALNDIDF